MPAIGAILRSVVSTAVKVLRSSTFKRKVGSQIIERINQQTQREEEQGQKINTESIIGFAQLFSKRDISFWSGVFAVGIVALLFILSLVSQIFYIYPLVNRGL